ncbi:MAG: FAD-binding oxidoreductase, partial [Alphaproteobacteria bacterium]|nr:FAD-binding oxidoreductase [Alphaproteobacteria bacterium]
LSESSVTVLNNPALLKALPTLLRNTSVGFRYRPWFVLKNLGWFARFLSYSTRKRTLHAAHALRNLMVISLDRHKQLIKEAKVEDLFRYQGWFKVFRSKAAFDSFRIDMEMMDETGVAYSIYDKDQIRQIEPGLKPIYEKAVMVDDTCGVTNPARLTDAYVALFEAEGGTVCRGGVTGLAESGGGWTISLNDRRSSGAVGRRLVG